MSEWIFLATESVANPEELKIQLGLGPFFCSPTPLKGRAGFYRNNFTLSEPAPWIYPNEISELRWSDFQASHNSGISEKVHWIPVFAQTFREPFSQIKEEILSGRLLKAVPHLTQRGNFTQQLDPSTRALQLLSPGQVKNENLKHKHPMGWNLGGESYVGLSPELLFTKTGSKVNTVALAGTAAGNQEEELKLDPKEIFEHELVVEGLKSTLAPLIEKIEQSPRQILNLGKLCHLKTNLHATLKDSLSLEALLLAMHPTPALGNYPRTQFSFTRSCPWLGAPLGYFNEAGDGTFVVTLRGLRIFEDHVDLTTGCGVTKNSVFEKEFLELELKRNSVKECFQI